MLLFDVDDSGSAMTVDVTKDVSEGWADTELDIIGPDVTDPGGDDKDAGCHRLLNIVLSQPQVAASTAMQISRNSRDDFLKQKFLWKICF